MLHAVVMAGGSGTRFWPKSRRNRPKQLLKLTGDATMLQQTVARIAPMDAPGRVWIVTGADQADDVRAQLPDVPQPNVGGGALPARHGRVRRAWPPRSSPGPTPTRR
jgi:mannose-1-phosphate guanylyltransferase